MVLLKPRLFLAVWLLLPIALAAYSPAEFPNPKLDLDKCGRDGVPSSICDPDLLLSKPTKDYIDGVVKAIWEGEPPYSTRDCAGKGQMGYQAAVAVMRKMELKDGETAAEAARSFAEALHKKWGVGDADCNNGVLLLIAVDDRRVQISTGTGAAETLTDAKVAHIIADIRGELRAADYDGAVKKAVVSIGLGLAGHSKDDSDGGVDWLGVVFFGGLAAVFGRAIFKSVSRKREFRECKRMLAKLKREQENLRSHAWSCPQSCPICLEDFQPATRSGASGANGASTSAAAGSSGLDEEAGPSDMLLSKSNSEAEFSRMSAAGQAAMKRLRQRRRSNAGGGASGSGWAEGSGPSTSPAGGAAAGGQDGGRKDRTPVTLGCGHTFCEPCIETWLDKGTTCPVCRKPISDGSGTESGDEQPPASVARQRVADDWLATDLAFRLMVLQQRYPTYITPAMVDTWSGEAQSTGSFSWENTRDFQLNDPAAVHHYQDMGSGGFSSSFGGGMGGGGGGGGSW